VLKVNIHQAKTHLSRYVKRAKAGETIILCDRNKPVAEIRPLSEKTSELVNAKRPIGFDDGRVKLGVEWDSAETNREVGELFGL
jgi:prevent-host-death family protein